MSSLVIFVLLVVIVTLVLLYNTEEITWEDRVFDMEEDELREMFLEARRELHRREAFL